MPLRGKHSNTGVFSDLLDFRVDAGDKVVEEHFRSCAGNANYASPRSQNEIIEISGDILRENIVSKTNTAYGFSVLADETADISGVEQRFVDATENGPVVHEEFIRFAMLKELHATAIAKQVVFFLRESELILANLIGQGYDGCSTMTGKEDGVSRIIREQCPRAHSFHCGSHKVNLVINDLKQVNRIPNTAAVIRDNSLFSRKRLETKICA